MVLSKMDETIVYLLFCIIDNEGKPYSNFLFSLKKYFIIDKDYFEQIKVRIH